jgi:hypothetical protein
MKVRWAPEPVGAPFATVLSHDAGDDFPQGQKLQFRLQASVISM